MLAVDTIEAASHLHLYAVSAELAALRTVLRMAGECRMSLQTSIRRFTEATGTPPGDWLVAERVEEAERQLTAGRLSIDEIAGFVGAGFVGMGTSDTLRHHFKRRVGIGPREYRARFGATQ